ncbi:Heat shock protein DnaJ, cysteine-rich domain containing protein [Quillaja saponaria]|uniref:Heat shock protein DnaJ, cysteine-rich domain containing protein n=1 Tax=Quillaja saponaria TaxID=32244 RepID=A0AAD7Q3M7_QUISA|nr:Heat shock protein DnaJ, cysteine-rich domain containing protein [Quillaja saponaria]
MDNITASELAGFGVGTLLLCATIAAPKIDAFISASQRSSLGMCKRCGNMKIIACIECKGIGLVKKGGLIGFNLVDDLYKTLGGDELKGKQTYCTKCRARGI